MLKVYSEILWVVTKGSNTLFRTLVDKPFIEQVTIIVNTNGQLSGHNFSLADSFLSKLEKTSPRSSHIQAKLC